MAPSNTAFNAASYFALQVHYNNPSLDNTLYDSSGVKVSFTPVLAQFQSVLLMVGVNTPKISLPPKQITHISYTCNSGALIPAGGTAFVWTNGLHAHTRARKIWVEQIRNNVIIDYVGCDLFYDFNKQVFAMKNVTLQRGDDLKIHCQYDTSAETATIKGGESTAQEMCLSYLGFYAVGFSVTKDQICQGIPVIEAPINSTSFCSAAR